MGLKRTGDGIFRDVEISAPAKNADGVTVSVVSYCYDPAQVKVVYAETGEPYENSPTETFVSRVTMELLPDGSWRASDSADERKPC